LQQAVDAAVPVQKARRGLIVLPRRSAQGRLGMHQQHAHGAATGPGDVPLDDVKVAFALIEDLFGFLRNVEPADLIIEVRAAVQHDQQGSTR
jgi:hypothetical protein